MPRQAPPKESSERDVTPVLLEETDRAPALAGASETAAPGRVRYSAGGELLRGLVGLLAITAIIAGALLLLTDLAPQLDASIRQWFKDLVAVNPAMRDWQPAPTSFDHASLAALPLLAGGAAFLILPMLLRPRLLELLQRLMLGAAFLIWGGVQLMPAGALADGLGDLVIVLFVVDLGLIIQSDLRRR